jgi:hypothetical protein
MLNIFIRWILLGKVTSFSAIDNFYDIDNILFALQGKRNNRAAEPPVDPKATHFLILISEGFREARGALSRSGTNLPSNQSPVKVDTVSVTPVTGAPPTSLPSGRLCLQYLHSLY